MRVVRFAPQNSSINKRNKTMSYEPAIENLTLSAF
jgi:hypothetical protein